MKIIYPMQYVNRLWAVIFCVLLVNGVNAGSSIIDDCADARLIERNTEEYTAPIVFLQDTVISGNQIRGLHIAANMVVNTSEEILVLVDRAKAKGANTVFFSDTKLNSFGINGTAGNRWDREMQELADGIKIRGVDLIFLTISMGFCGSVIADDTNLTTGFPIINQPLKAVNGNLKPVSTSSILNGGFENYQGNRLSNWTFQDAVGTRTFVDTNVKRSGQASFRAEARGGEMSRIITNFPVEPFHQYTLRFWIKTENLSAANLLAIVRDNDNRDRNLTNLRLSTPNSIGGRSYFNRPQNLTLDWTEMRIAFNSLEATTVNLGLSVFGGQNGIIWWDDVEILDTPTLNWLNRDDLPVSISRDNGSRLTFGNEIALPVDTQLGQSGYPGRYDTHHTAPEIIVNDSSLIQEGEVLKISGYHALPTANGQISCSWNNPEVYDRMRQIHQALQDQFQPDGFLLNYSEIRGGGWEPLDTVYPTSGEALAVSIEQAYTDIFQIAPNGKHYFWNDMVDPVHNAKANYYQVNNTLDQSWLTLDPQKVIIATWWEGQKITDFGPASLNFFSDLGFQQIYGAFYDEDVTENYNRWQAAGDGVGGIIGNLYATWINDFSKIEEFGDLWWADTVQTIEEITFLSAPDTVSPGVSYTVNFSYNANESRDLTILLQLNESPWTQYANESLTVSAGEGNISLDVQVNSLIPIANDAYKWSAIMTPVNGVWEERISVLTQSGVNCVPLITDSILSINAPTEVRPDSTYTVEVNYSVATLDREIVVVFQSADSNNIEYGSTRTNTTSSDGTLYVDVTIDSSTPPAVDAYKWSVFIVPEGGSFDDRLSNLETVDIDVLSNGTAIEVYYIRNKAAGNYLRPENGEVDAQLQATANDNTNWFKWEKVPSDNGNYYLKNAQTGMFLRPKRTKPGSIIQQKPNTLTGRRTQWMQWLSDDDTSYHIANRLTLQYLEVPNEGETSKVIQNINNLSNNRSRWIFEPTTAAINSFTFNNRSVNRISTIDANYKLYPHPTDGLLNVESIKPVRSMMIYDLQGQLQLQTQQAGQRSLITSVLPEGFYVVYIVFEDNTTSNRKLMVVH